MGQKIVHITRKKIINNLSNKSSQKPKIIIMYCLILSAILFVNINLCSEFDNDLEDEIFDDGFNNSVEFNPVQTTENTATRRSIRRHFIRYQPRKSNENTAIRFPQTFQKKPSVKSIKLYQCGNFFMKCLFRPNYDVDFPLSCTMVSNADIL